MLPSTGYFKGISCPFYDSGLCERPYCHFRHAKRDSQNTERDSIEGEEILQKLVSAAVQKVLQQTEKSTSLIQTSSIDHTSDNIKNNAVSVSKATYNPTPISELNKISVTDAETIEENEQRKRHIPVPYTPRKPASVSLRKPPETNGSFKPYIYIPPQVKYTPGCAENVQCDSYTPPGSTESKEKYLPGTEKKLQEYTPDNNAQHKGSVRNYVPSDKSVNKAKVLEYQPTKLTTKKELQSVTYQPTPRSLAPCFSSDEDEPDVKKRKLSNDLNGLDDLGPEFDILDQILDEETHDIDSKNKVKKDEKVKDKNVAFSNKTDKAIDNLETENSLRNIMETVKEHSKNTKNESRTEKQISKSYSEEIQDNAEPKNRSSRKQNSVTGSKENNERNKDVTKSHKDKSRKSKSDIDNNECTTSVDKEINKYSKKKSKYKSSNKDKERISEKNKHRKSDRHSEKDKQSNTLDKYTKSSKHSSSRSDSRNSKSSKSHRSSKDSKEKYKSKNKTSKNVPHQHSEQITDEHYSLSDSDEEAIALECKKIFEEYVPTAKVNTVEDASQVEEINHDEEYIPGKKRISRTNDNNVKVIPKLPVKPNFKITAVQAMTERLAKVKEFHNSRNIVLKANNDNVTNKIDVHKNNFSTQNSGNSKIRIAHVPYASTLMHAKKDISQIHSTSKSESTSNPSTSTTITQTVKKGVQRVAHIPNEKFIDRPGVLEPLSSKITANIRSTYLNMMIDECLKLYISATDAYARAQHEELATSKKCSTVQIYKNSAVLTVNRLRKELQECHGVKKSSCDISTTEKGPDVISGKSSNMGSWSIECKNRKSIDHSKELSGAKFYNNISKWIMTEEQLQANGFPRPHISGQKGRAIIYGQNKQKPPKGLIRTCCRCKKDYTIDKKGFPALKEECIYHPNNKYRVRGEVRYQCCSQDGTSDGCCIAPSHVYEYVDFENLKGFVKTLPPDSVMDDYGIYSLDCEMCYTTHGLDLTRVTVINATCKVVYETLIKPLHPIIDYNTRFSGITEEQMTEVKTTLLDVQATLLTMFNNKTILIGHSLESDFKALKLIHDTVIDTSVLYPHKMGPPYKRALRNLSSEYLKKIIQNSVDGHNSAEDALVCMELIHYKLKEELKIR